MSVRTVRYVQYDAVATTMSKDKFRGREKDVGLFEKGQIIGMHRLEKTAKEFAETIKTGLRTVQHN